MTDIATNFEKVQAAINRMELDLLNTLLKRRSELLAVLVDGILDNAEEADGNHDRVEMTLREVGRQNAVIRARVDSRTGDKKRELVQLHQRAQLKKAYPR